MLYIFGHWHRTCHAATTLDEGPENNFQKQEYFNKASIEWLDYIAHRDGLGFQHADDVDEKRIGQYLVDGFDRSNQTIYEFNGCYFHGHQCKLNNNEFNERVGIPMSACPI